MAALARPATKRVRVATDIAQPDFDKLAERADTEGRSVANLLRRIITDALREGPKVAA